MRKAFSQAGCSIPRFTEVLTDDLNVEEFDFPLIVKPVDRSGSRAVSKVNFEKDLIKAVKYAKEESFSKGVLIEEYIEGEEVSVESVSWKGDHKVLVITDKITTGSPHFVELAHHQPSALPGSIQEIIKLETIKCLDALDIKYGASHSEFKITSDGKVFVIEVGARMGGDFIGSSLVELSTGYDFLKATINIAINKYEEKKTDVLIKGYSGVYFLSKETEILLPYFDKKNYFEIKKEILNTELKVLTNSNDRSGYLIYKSDKKIDIL
jgi:biotin carboxylase